MTLVIAMKWMVKEKDAVVMASDSRVSLHYLTFEERKIYPIVFQGKDGEIPVAIAGGAGDVSIIKQAFRISEKIFRRYWEEIWNKKSPKFEQFEDAVNDIERELISRFRYLRSEDIDLSFGMILGGLSPSGKASMYLFDERGLAEPIHENPGFALIGSGFFTGGNLLLKLLDYDPNNPADFDLGLLTAFIIDLVSEVDASVGPFVGESWLMRIENGNTVLGPLKEESIKEFKERVKLRRKIIREIWRLGDHLGEEEILKVIEKIEKKEGNH